MIEIILFGRALKYKGVARMKKRTWAGLWVRQIFLLKVREDLGLQDRYSTFMLHLFLLYKLRFTSAFLTGQYLQGPLIRFPVKILIQHCLKGNAFSIIS